MFSVYEGTRTYMISQAEKKLVHASDVFKRRMSMRIDYLRVEADLLGSSYALKNAVLKNNKKQLNKILNDITLNMGYDHIVLMQNDGKVLVDLFKNGVVANSYKLNDLKKNKVILNKKSATIIVVKNHVYEFVMVPITILMPDGIKNKFWLGIGSEVIDDTLTEMKNLYTLKLDILFRKQDENKKWHSLASSLKVGKGAELSVLSLNQIKKMDIKIASPQIAYIKNIKYIILPVKFITPGRGDNFQVLLMYKFSQVLSGVYSLMTVLLIIFMIGLLLTIICSLLLAKRIAKPISTLSEAVSRVIDGDYNTDIIVKGKDEISHLSQAISKMINTIKQREKTIRHQSLHNLNTNLPNRIYFKHILKRILNNLDKSTSNVSLLFIGFERIAEINNTLGHEFGVLLIKQIAERLKSVEKVHYLAHFGSSEFVLLVKNYDTYSNLKSLTKSILNLLELPFKISGACVDVNAYIGVCQINEKIKNPSIWLRNADHAHYVAKSDGKKYRFYTKEIDQRNTHKLSLMGELIKAIEDDNLEIFYQPKVCLSNSGNIQAEALIRWNHPKFGLLSPDEFIPLAEQTGHIQKLTKWIIYHVIIQLKELKKIQDSIKIAVNISAKDLSNSKILSYISSQLKLHNINPNNLVLEVTESAIMKNTDQALKILLAFRNLGVIISIDDFGTGYSSMEYLTKLPIQEMKIDQSFIKNMHANKNDALIVRSLINLAHNFGLTTVGEGVECEEVKNILINYGCDLAQGYYFSKALRAKDFESWIRNQK
ncbi:MAG: diguanylate cyclase (GGDEF)-like protein [Francisellaceae bacterium]